MIVNTFQDEICKLSNFRKTGFRAEYEKVSLVTGFRGQAKNGYCGRDDYQKRRIHGLVLSVVLASQRYFEPGWVVSPLD
jgi:hypothetical protein